MQIGMTGLGCKESSLARRPMRKGHAYAVSDRRWLAMHPTEVKP